MNLNNDFRKNLTKGKFFDKVSVKGGVRVMSRDVNFCPTRGYPAQLDPNGLGFTRSD